MCHKNINTESGLSNIQNDKHDEKVNNNTKKRKKDDSANHPHVASNNNAWVGHISSTLLTKVQMKLLSHGPNYPVVPRSPPITDYIAAIKQACTVLKQRKAEELRGEVKAIIKKTQPPKYNLTREEHKALKELKKDKNRMILTADKGVSIVVIDKEEYTRKAEELLRQPTYKLIPTDQTNKYKNKLISLLKKIKTEGVIDEVT